MKRQKIYISGQISGLEPEDAESSFNKMEKTLRAQGYSVANPTRLGIEDVSGRGWDYYMKEGIKLLMDCDERVICFKVGLRAEVLGLNGSWHTI
jgi:hypothetical protein